MSTIYHDVLSALGVKPGQLLFIVDADVGYYAQSQHFTLAVVASSGEEAERLLADYVKAEGYDEYYNLAMHSLSPGDADTPQLLNWNDVPVEIGDDDE